MLWRTVALHCLHYECGWVTPCTVKRAWLPVTLVTYQQKHHFLKAPPLPSPSLSSPPLSTTFSIEELNHNQWVNLHAHTCQSSLTRKGAGISQVPVVPAGEPFFFSSGNVVAAAVSLHMERICSLQEVNDSDLDPCHSCSFGLSFMHSWDVLRPR